jgi:hypothetical protein
MDGWQAVYMPSGQGLLLVIQLAVRFQLQAWGLMSFIASISRGFYHRQPIISLYLLPTSAHSSSQQLWPRKAPGQHVV